MTLKKFPGRAFAAAAPAAIVFALGLLPSAPARAASFDYRVQGPLTFSGIPPLNPMLAQRLERYAPWPGTRFLEWLPEGGMLVAERLGERVRLESLTAALAPPRTLASPSLPVRWARFRGGSLAYVRLSDGHPQLYVEAGKGPARQVTQGDELRGTPRWSADGRSIAFYGAGPGGSQGAVYVENIDQGGLPRLVVGGLKGSWQLLDWSVDGKKLLLADVTRPEHNLLYVANVGGGAPERLGVPAARIPSARFAPQGSAIYLVSDQGGEFERLYRFDPGTRALQRVSADVPWGVERFAVSADGRYTAYTVDDDGRSVLTVIDNRLQLAMPVPWLRNGVIGALDFGRGHRLAISYQSARRPPGVYVYDADHRVLERWTRRPAALLARPPVAARLIHYPTWDRVNGNWRMISAYVYLPPAPAPAPVLILLHAGVDSQFRPRWRPFIQFVVNELGFAVIAPNVRGSSGYGRTFRSLADGWQRDDAVRDVGSLLVWIGMQPGLDVHRTALMGRGYGGWLALNSLATFDGHLLGVIDVAGMADLTDYVTHAPAGRIEERIAQFGNAEDPSVADFLRRISPLGEVARIRRPILIVQGLQGTGTRARNSQQLAYLLRYHRDEVWLLTASDTGNDFSAPADRQALRITVAQFLENLLSRRPGR